MVDQLRSTSLLASMRIILHVSFATLLFVALGRSTLGVSPTLSMHKGAIIALGVALGALYFAGTFIEKRNSDQGKGVSRVAAMWWLWSITALWLTLLVGNPEFSWLAFPLFFVHLTVLPVRWGSVSVGIMTVAVILVQLSQAQTPQAAMVLGPLLGATFAGAMTWIYRGLLVDLGNQRRLVAQLRQTRADLSRTQHEAGVIAERERMAREIHDTLAQGLSSIILVSGAARTALDSGDISLAGQRLEVVETAARENLAEARSFVRGTATQDGATEQSQEDTTAELGRQLQKLCAGAQEQLEATGAPAQVEFVAVGEPVGIPAGVATEVARMAQSLLGNVVAHSQALRSVVTLTVFSDSLTLDVYDSGKGFDLPALDQPHEDLRQDGSGFGLRSAAQRAADLGGTLTIESGSGRGTLVTVRVPLPLQSQA